MSLLKMSVVCLFYVINGACDVAFAAQDNQGRGRIAMSGQIVDSACALEARSAHQTIELGALSMGQLVRLGESAPHTLSLRLVKCLLVRPDPVRPHSYLSDWQHVRVTFDGVTSSDGKLFAIAGSANGIALRITDAQGQQSVPGVPMALVPLTGNDQELHYTLQLVGNGRPMAVGSHRTAVRFRLEYF